MKHLIQLCIATLALGSGGLIASDIPWGDKPYSYEAKEEPLSDLLRTLCANRGLVTVISEKVDGLVSGRFNKWNAEKFFKSMAAAYSLVWYYDGSVLYIYGSDESVSKMITVEYLDLEKLDRVLRRVGIHDNRFPLRIIEEDGLIYVSGPKRFVDLVAETVDMLETNAGMDAVSRGADKSIEVFPLKHAWADDLVFSVMGSNVVVPGVATVLQRILSGNPAQNQAPQRQINRTVTKLKGRGLAAVDDPQEQTAIAPNPNGAVIQADVRMNAVIIRDHARNMPYYRELIDILDVPSGLVEIRAAIIDVNSTISRDLGVNWRAEKENRYSGGFDTNPDQAFGNQPIPGGAGLNLATIVGNSARNFLAKIRALEENGEAKMLSRPSVITLNNVEAQVEHSQTFYVRVAGRAEVDLFPVTTGVILQVTPHIIPGKGNRIKLAIRVEDGGFSDLQVDDIPVLRKSAINTQAVVGEGESLLIGGYIHEELGESVSSVPGLGRVPVIKHAFRNKQKHNRKLERLFLITPRIVNSEYSPTGPGDISELTPIEPVKGGPR